MATLLEYYNIIAVFMQSHQSDYSFASLKQTLMSKSISMLSSNLVLLFGSSLLLKFL